MVRIPSAPAGLLRLAVMGGDVVVMRVPDPKAVSDEMMDLLGRAFLAQGAMLLILDQKTDIECLDESSMARLGWTRSRPPTPRSMAQA